MNPPLYIIFDPYDPEKDFFIFSEKTEAEVEFHFRKYVKYSDTEMPRVSIWEVLGMTKYPARNPWDISPKEILPF